MVVRQLFILWTHPLFLESVRLILNHPYIEWLGSTSDYAAALDQILSLQPDIVIVEEMADGFPTFALAILEVCNWDVTVFCLSLTDNQLCVYHREQRIVGQTEDLIHLIHGNQEG